MTFNTIKITDTESTNTLLKKMASEGAEIGTTLVATRQSGGKGRLGRSFSSNEGGLYVSIILPYNENMSAGLLTTYAAVAVARSIEKLAPVKVDVKWVNDLLVNGKKICGILTEGIVYGDKTLAILGIGVNLTNKLPDELADIASNLFDLCGVKIVPDDLLNEILTHLSDFEDVDFEKSLEEYRHRCVTLGKKVEVIPHQGEKYRASAIDLHHDGSLIVKRASDGEILRIFSGEVSTKLSEGVQ